MNEEFEGRKVVITGAAGVFGAQLARAFAEAGSALCLSDLRADALTALERDLGLAEGRVLTHATDLTSEESIRDLVAMVASAWRAPDLVINNAGIYPFGGLLEIDVGCWDRVMATNLRAPFLIMQGFARAMIAERVKGCFVNVSSGAADILRTSGVPYCVSKRGLEWLSKGFALDLARDGIRVNCVRPGFAVGSALVTFPPGYAETMSQANPMGRVTEPGDLAGAVMFLASDAASYVTGEFVSVDGGSSIPRRAGGATEARRRD
jgi:3-oxoacyl-[acyl-carrier protein] reductase